MSRRAWRDVLQAAVTALLLWLAWRMAGGPALLGRLEAAEPAWLAAALALTVPMQCLSAWRWRYTARRLGGRLGFRRALADYYLASLLNGVLPTGLAGDAVRVWRHARAQAAAGGERYRLALHAVLLERASGQLALALVAAAGVLASSHALPGMGRASLGLVALGLLVVLSLGIFASVALGVGVGNPRAMVAALLQDVRRAYLPLATLATQLTFSLSIVATYLASFYFVSAALGVWLAPGAAMVTIPLVLYVMVLPVSVGGLGPRELTAAALWPLIGLPAADGALAAFLYWTVMLAGSLPAVFLLGAAHQTRRRPGRS